MVGVLKNLAQLFTLMKQSIAYDDHNSNAIIIEVIVHCIFVYKTAFRRASVSSIHFVFALQRYGPFCIILSENLFVSQKPGSLLFLL